MDEERFRLEAHAPGFERGVDPLDVPDLEVDGGAPLGGTTSALITDSTTAWTQYTVFAVAPSNAATAALAASTTADMASSQADACDTHTRVCGEGGKG